MFALLVQLQGNAGPMRVLSMAGLMGMAGEELAQEHSPSQIALEEKKAGQGYCEVRFRASSPSERGKLDFHRIASRSHRHIFHRAPKTLV